jgi:hypothetical protein
MTILHTITASLWCLDNPTWLVRYNWHVQWSDQQWTGEGNLYHNVRVSKNFEEYCVGNHCNVWNLYYFIEFICWQVLESRFVQDGSGSAWVWCVCFAIFLGWVISFEPRKISDPQTQEFNCFLLSSCEAYSVFSCISRYDHVQNEVHHICAKRVFKVWKWWEGSQRILGSDV